MSDEHTAEAPMPRPSSSLHSPAVDFVENELQNYHPAFDNRYVQFDPSLDRFVPRSFSIENSLAPGNVSNSTLMVPSPLSPSQQATRPAPSLINEMSFWVDVFPKAMQMLREYPVPSNLDDPKWGIRPCSTWVEVQAQLDMARREYNFQHGSERAGNFRRAVRSGLDKHSVTLKQASKFVPDVDIAKPVVGAIEVVLDAYRQSSEVRKEVTKNFDELPEVFEGIESYLQTYPKDQNIFRASCHLVRSIFKSIEHAVAFFTSHQVKRAGVAIFSGSEYQRVLRDCLAEIKSCCDSLKNQAGMSLAHRVTNDNQHMMHQNDTIMQENQIMQSVLGAIRQQGETQYQQTQLNTFGIQYCVSSINMMLSILRDQQSAWPAPRPATRYPSPMPQLIEPEPSWHPEDIWNCLHMPIIDVGDLAHVVGQMELRLHEDGGRTQQLLDNHLFRQWMGHAGPSRLLVHGEYQPPHDISPLSVLCTILSYTFRDPGVPRTIGLVFFCGQHQKRDMFQGASVMIRSLIAQLMTQFRFGTISASPDIHLKDIEGEDLDKLCELFSILVRTLPSNMRIFCLIDGISLYENNIFLHEMSTAVMSLVKMADQLLERHGPSFKLLITSPQPTREVRRVFPDPNTLVHMKSFPNAGSNMSVPSMQNHLKSGMR